MELNHDGILIRLGQYQRAIGDVQFLAKSLLVGRRARYVSNFNGQPIGRSRKPLTGKEFEIKDVSVEEHHIWLWDGDFEHCCCEPKDVEFI